MKKYIISKDIFESVYLQQGGQIEGGQEQLMMQIAEALQQGATPEEILQQLIDSGIPQDQAIQIVQAVFEQMQGQQQPQEQMMQMGGTSSPKLTGYGAFNQTTAFGTIGRKQMTPQELEYVTKKTGLKDSQFNDNLPVVEKYLNQFRTGIEPIGTPQTDKNNGFTISENGRTNAGVYNRKTDTFNFAEYQEGGQQDVTAQVAQALNEGVDPQQILTQLVESGMDEAQATQLIQGVLGQIQNNEQPQFEKGGMYKKDAAVNAGVVEEEVSKNIANSEIEKNEYIFDSKGIRKAVGNTHEKGGIQTKLEDGAKVLSDHLKVGDAAEKLSEKLGKKIKPTLTYAKVLDVYNKESGIDDINNEIIKLTEQLEKSQAIKDEATSDINTEFLIGKIATQTDKKKPLEKEQQTMFQVLFDIQEQSKSTNSSNEKFQDGGTKVLQEISEKYNIPLENLMKAVPQYQAGGNVSVNNTQSVFTNQPSATDWLPYTPVENATNPLWVGQAYDTQWIPLVEKSLADPKQAKQIEDWLLSNKQYGENIAYQLNGLEGQARIDRIKQLATDKKPGTFHNAFLQAVQETAESTQLKEVVINGTKPANTIAPFNGKNSGQETIMSTLDMPNRPINMPTWNPSLKVSTRLNRIDTALISPEQQLAETDRAIQSAQQDLSNLSPAQRAVANIGLTAQQIASNSKAIADTNRFNAQTTNQANIYNARVGDQEQQAENQNALNYEARTLTGLGRYENDLNNLQNQQFRDQVEKWKNIQIYNANNAMSPDVQFTNEGYKVYTPTLSDLNLSFVNTPKEEPKKKTTKKKLGGRFKK